MLLNVENLENKTEEDSLTLYHTILTFNDSDKKPFENIVGKGENAETSIFSFAHYVFYVTSNTFQFFFTSYIFCKCFQFVPV